MSYDTTRTGLDGHAPSPLVSALRQRWWLVLAIALVAAAGASIGQAKRSPTYTTSAQILVTPYAQPNDASLAGIRLLRESGDGARNLLTATTLLGSSANAAATARRLGPGWTAADVDSGVALEPVGGSNVIAVEATAGDPERAAALANAYAATALAARNAEVADQAGAAIKALRGQAGTGAAAQRQQLNTLREQGDPTLSLAQPATAPAGPDGPAKWMVIAAALLVGAVLGMIGAFLLERGDRRVRDRGELLRRIPVPVLTSVPAVRNHSGIDMPPAVREAFRTLQIQLDMQDHEGCRRILVTSASSGDGKTTAVLNLAFALVGAGRRVIVIDFDLRRPDLARQLGLQPSPDAAATLTTGRPLAEIMRAAPRLPPLRIVQVASGPHDVALLPQLTERMRAVLAEAEALADYVLIDTAPLGEVGDALPILDLVDGVLVVGRPGSTDRRSLEAMAGLFERTGVQPLGWVVAGVDTQPSTYYTPAAPRRAWWQRA